MCGRFFRHDVSWADYRAALDLIAPEGVEPPEPTFNAAPMSLQPVLRRADREDHSELVPMVWSLIPSWWKKPLSEKKFTSFNAKCETLAEKPGAQVVDFTWDGQYPKKRQWCLDHLDLKYDRVFFVDADEIVTRELAEEIAALDWRHAGYFVKGRYVFEGRLLKFGLRNNKLALFDRRKMAFPVVDDLDLPGMGEIEGHYQPVLKAMSFHEEISMLRHSVIHDAQEGWQPRHERYALWEAGMIKQRAYPKDPVAWREILKQIYRGMPLRGAVAFFYSYIFKLGILDGKGGLDFSRSRWQYYKMVNAALKTSKAQGSMSVGHKPDAAPS